MKLVKVTKAGKAAEGILENGIIHVIGGWHDVPSSELPFTLTKFSLAKCGELMGQSSQFVKAEECEFAVPIDPAAKILCVGMNYRDHVSEIKLDVSANPTIFQRFSDSIVSHEADIVRPHASETFDFEGEIAIVIGKDARHVAATEAMDYVGGYSVFMDGSVRQYQKHSLTAGKNWYRSGSMGPWIIPAARMETLNPSLETRVNGQTMQSAQADQMIFDIPHIIEYCSRFTLLRPGDIIATGTPGGVGSRREPPLWLKPGDLVEVEVEGIGVLANSVIAEG